MQNVSACSGSRKKGYDLSRVWGETLSVTNNRYVPPSHDGHPVEFIKNQFSTVIRNWSGAAGPETGVAVDKQILIVV